MASLRDLTAVIHLQANTEGLEKINESLEHVNNKLEFLAASEFVHWIGELAEKYSHFGESTEAAAAAAGITSEKFQALAFAASQNAVSQGEMQGALSRLSRTLGAARDGSKQAVESFGKLGITPEQVKGFHDSSEALMAIADKVKGIQDPIKRTQILMQVLGKGSANMAKLMAAGSVGIKEKMQEAVDLGAVVSDEDVEQLANLEDSMSAFEQILKATAASLAAAFAPSIRAAVKAMSQFWAVNRKVIEVNFKKWAWDIGFAMGYTYGVVTDVIGIFTRFIAKHETLVEVVGTVILAYMAMSLAVTKSHAMNTGLIESIKNFPEVCEATKAVAGAPWAIFTKGGLAARWVLVRVIGMLGSLVGLLAPGLGGWIASLAAWVGGLSGGVIGVGLAAIVVIGHDLYEYFVNGAKLEDLWLYKLFVFLKNTSKGVLKKLGVEFNDPKLPDNATVDAEGVPHLLRNAAEHAEAVRTGAAAMQAPMAARTTNENTQNNTISIEAPITLQLPEGADPQAVAAASRAGVQDHMDYVLRQAKLNAKSVVVY